MSAVGRPTSKDVAQEAGVSQSTVSLVLGGKWTGRVSPATARSVRSAAERLGYRPNQAARNLRLGTTRTVLLMVPTLTAPFFGPVYTGAARVAARHGFGVVVATWPDEPQGPDDDPYPTSPHADDPHAEDPHAGGTHAGGARSDARSGGTRSDAHSGGTRSEARSGGPGSGGPGSGGARSGGPASGGPGSGGPGSGGARGAAGSRVQPGSPLLGTVSHAPPGEPPLRGGTAPHVPWSGPFASPGEAIDGVLASSMSVEALARFRETPAVMLDSGPSGPGPGGHGGAGDGRVPTVDFGVADGMRAIAEHLAGLGHRRVGHVAAAVDQWTFRARARALAAAVAATPGGVLSRAMCAIDVTSAKDAAGRLLDRPDRPTALVCDDDLIAAGAYKAARARGLDIPGDLSVTGFDDVLLATALEPELTTVRLPAEELGAEGMRALLELLSGRRPAPRVLPGELMVRDSTAPPA